MEHHGPGPRVQADKGEDMPDKKQWRVGSNFLPESCDSFDVNVEVEG